MATVTGAVLETVVIRARDIPDAWFQCLWECYDKGYEYTIDRGSYEGQRRKELDFVLVQIEYPGVRPLIPDIPPGLGVPPPTDMDYVNRYAQRYLMTSEKEEGEYYTYGEDLAVQIPEVIKMYTKDGYNTNQAFMAVGSKESIFIRDPQCLRGIDTRIRYGKLHFFVYFRSWDLWGGFPVNLAGIQLLKEDMAAAVGVEDGALIATSKGLHLYDHCWEVAKMRLGKFK